MRTKILNSGLFFITITAMVFITMNCSQNNDKTKSVYQETKISEASPSNYEKYVFETTNLKRYQFPTHINDLIVDRKDANNSEVFMVIIEPGKAPLLHKHDDTEQIFYIIDGTGVLTIGKEENKFNVKPGDVVRIPISTYHSIKSDDHNTMKYLCVDCFAVKPEAEPTWDDHVKVVCKTNGWDYEKVALNK